MICKVEQGYICSGEPSDCTSICGNGKRASNEECDDFGTENGDGCAANCTIEADSTCDITVDPSNCDVCGNDKSKGLEVCDDGLRFDNKGCTPDCLDSLPGWICDSDDKN